MSTSGYYACSRCGDSVKEHVRGSLLRQRTIGRRFVEFTIIRRIVGS
jgi:hypothetical protein